MKYLNHIFACYFYCLFVYGKLFFTQLNFAEHKILILNISYGGLPPFILGLTRVLFFQDTPSF